MSSRLTALLNAVLCQRYIVPSHWPTPARRPANAGTQATCDGLPAYVLRDYGLGLRFHLDLEPKNLKWLGWEQHGLKKWLWQRLRPLSSMLLGVLEP